MMWQQNKLTELFGTALPIVQAPMAGAAGLELAVAVSEAGGLGSLACAPLDAGQLAQSLEAAARATGKPLNVNFFCHHPPGEDGVQDQLWLDKLAPYFDEVDLTVPTGLSTGPIQSFDEARCEVLEARPPAVVSFHFGLPSKDLVARVKATGAKLVSSATTVEEARDLVARGCDAVIAQGFEAGGHRGMFLTDDPATQIGGISLIPRIVDAVDVPVIAAGGIADARTVTAALVLGASAVQIGTAFLFTKEATISRVYRQQLLASDNIPTALSNVFSGRPTRCLVNRMMQEIGPVASDAPAFPKGFSVTAPLRTRAEANGCPDFSAHYCGQSAALAQPATAAGFINDLVASMNEHMKKVAALSLQESGD
jgi:nitronate monooxygenase